MISMQILIIFVILFYLNYVHSVGNPLELVTRYRQEILNHKLNEKKHQICEMSGKLLWVSICYTIFDIIKDNEQEYNNSLFLNYFVFASSPSWCINMKLNFDQNEISFSGTEEVTQKMMPCFGRREALIPYDNLINGNNGNGFFIDFWIYPQTFSSWMLFKYNHETKYFKLFDWFDNINIYAVNKELLDIFPPVIYSNDVKYQFAVNSLMKLNEQQFQICTNETSGKTNTGKIIQDEIKKHIQTIETSEVKARTSVMSDNIVIKATKEQFSTLCSISYNRMPYSQNMHSNSWRYRQPSPTKLVFIRIPHDGFHLTCARECKIKFGKEHSSYVVLDYKLSPGVNNGSVVLLKTNRNIKPIFGYEVCDVLEAADNVGPHYFNYLF